MDGQQLQCVICQEVHQDGCASRSLPCHHTFHEECVNQWLRENPTCPICRSDVGGEQATGEHEGEHEDEHNERGVFLEMDQNQIHQILQASGNRNRNRRFIARFRTSLEQAQPLSAQDVDRITAFDLHYSDPTEPQDVAATRLRLIIRNFHATPRELGRIMLLEGQRILDMAATNAAQSLPGPLHQWPSRT